MDSKTQTTTPAAPSANSGRFKKLLSKSDFLTLEHTAHMFLTFMLCIFIIAAVFSAFSMWTGSLGMASVIGGLSQAYFGGSLRLIEAMLALLLVVVLFFAPLINIILDRRTRASWQSRTGFAARLGYKLPLYGAMGAVALGLVISIAHMAYVILVSLALIGVPNAPFGMLYITIFLPFCVAAVAFGSAFWYLVKLARGVDNGRRYSNALAAVSWILALALLITSVLLIHRTNTQETPKDFAPSYGTQDEQYYQDLLNNY